MTVLSKASRIIQVEVKNRLPLRPTARNGAAGVDLSPGVYEFYLHTFNDSRPRKEWAILKSDERFGIPIEMLKRLDGTDEIVAKENGRYYFNE